jgi:hypothetical protein
VRDTEKEKERSGEKRRGGERESVTMSVHACVFLYTSLCMYTPMHDFSYKVFVIVKVCWI